MGRVPKHLPEWEVELERFNSTGGRWESRTVEVKGANRRQVRNRARLIHGGRGWQPRGIPKRVRGG